MTEEQREEGILKQCKGLPSVVKKYIDFLIGKINKLVKENRRLAKHIVELQKDKGELTDKIADIKANCDLAIEGRDVKIVELEQKLEQAEKDLADYQFNYPTIKELSEENNKLLDVINNQDVKIINLEKKNKWYSEQICFKECAEVWGENAKMQEQLEQAKEIIKDFIAWFTDQTESTNWKPIVEQAEQFLKHSIP